MGYQKQTHICILPVLYGKGKHKKARGSRMSLVYLVSSGISDSHGTICKIGWTRAGMKQRLNGIRRCVFDNPKVLWVHKTDNAEKLEKDLHHLFRNKRHGLPGEREVFRLTERDIETINIFYENHLEKVI
jgi:hypothetical protein